MAFQKSAVLSFGLLLIYSASLAAAKPDLWDFWLKNDPTSKMTVDHSAWDRFLQSYLVMRKGDVNRIQYGQVSLSDQTKLSGYIELLEQTTVSRLNRAEQKAFWINLYNALTVKVILDHYPVKSIRDIDISPGLFFQWPLGEKTRHHRKPKSESGRY